MLHVLKFELNKFPGRQVPISELKMSAWLIIKTYIHIFTVNKMGENIALFNSIQLITFKTDKHKNTHDIQ